MLRIENLHVAVADKPILNGVDLSINAGEVHATRGRVHAARFLRPTRLGCRGVRIHPLHDALWRQACVQRQLPSRASHRHPRLPLQSHRNDNRDGKCIKNMADKECSSTTNLITCTMASTRSASLVVHAVRSMVSIAIGQDLLALSLEFLEDHTRAETLRL